MTERINSILKYYKTNSSKFAEEIGVQKSSISHVLSGRNKPSLDFIQKLLSTYPEINADWLILGKGEMINDDSRSNLFSTSPEKEMDVSEHTPKITFKENQIENPKPKLNTISEHGIQNLSANKSAKKATKIVIFYGDDSFKEFYPENS